MSKALPIFRTSHYFCACSDVSLLHEAYNFSGAYINKTSFPSDTTFTFPVDQRGRAEIGASTGVQLSNQPHPCIHVRARAVYKDLETNLEFKSPYTLFERCAD